MARLQTDVCVVGSGVAGAIVAQELLAAGRGVVMLEAGGRAAGRALGLRLLEYAIRDYRIPRMRLWHRGATYRRSDFTGRGFPMKGRALAVRGGSTLGWSGDAYRMKPEDFRLASCTGVGLDWPIGYEDLEPYYTTAETTIGVAGDHTDPGHPYRGAPFPHPAKPFHDRDEPFLKLLSNHGWGPMHHNVSLSRTAACLRLTSCSTDSRRTRSSPCCQEPPRLGSCPALAIGRRPWSAGTVCAESR